MIIITAIVLLLALVTLFAGLRALLQLRLSRGFTHLLCTIVLLMVGFISFTIGSITYTYQALTNEENIALVTIKQAAEQTFMVSLLTANGTSNTYLIKGDQWMLSGQVLVWKNIGQLLGLQSRIRLYRLEGMYNDLQQEKTAEHTVYDLSAISNPAWWQLSLNQSLIHWLTRTIYGGAVFMPLIDDSHYRIKLTQTGLIAIPE